MTDEELGELMRQCWNEYPGIHKFDPFKFGRLVTATEREACAKVCEDIPLPKNPPELTHLPTIERCAAAIRARGET